MQIALFADIHANAPALEACLAAAQGADQLVFLGDLVGYGADPEQVVERVSDLAGRGAIVLKGNHDAAIAEARPRMNATALAAITWTRGRLGAAAAAWLEALPLTGEIEDLLFVHASADRPSDWTYVLGREEAQQSLAATAARVTFCGHVHECAFYAQATAQDSVRHVPKTTRHTPVTGVAVPLLRQCRWLGVLGSVGQPRDGNPAAAFAFYDTATTLLTCQRAAYDVEAAAARVRRAGLPQSLAARLLEGR